MLLALVPPWAAAEEQPTLSGRLLVAAEQMGDPRFAHSVVYMVQHDNNGAFGLIINRRLSRRPLAEIITALGGDGAGITAEVDLHFGGPVEPGRVFVLHSTDYRVDGTMPADGGRVAVTSTLEALMDLAGDKAPKRSLLIVGYAGWGPGQLEGELARRDWHTATADQDLVFGSGDARDKWRRAMSRRDQAI